MPDPLTLARATPLGPYVPATEDWISGWVGPVAIGRKSEAHLPTGQRYWVPATTVDVIKTVHEDRVIPAADVPMAVALDTRRPEVRDRLVRLGLLPHALRDHPGAAVAAGMGVKVSALREPWMLVGPSLWTRTISPLTSGDPGYLTACVVDRVWTDIMQLRRGNVLAEPDGYLIPLPGGGVGFVSKESP